MLSFGLGEVAALITSLSWAGSNYIHTAIGLRIGGPGVTMARAPLYVAATALVALFSGVPFSMPEGTYFFLAISGIFGVALCDSFLYAGSVLVGSRLAVLMQSLSACLTAILGYLFLNEPMNAMCAMGILTATFGVAFVLMEGGLQTGTIAITRAQFTRGIVLTFLSALFLAISFMLLKRALAFGIHPVWAVCVRMSTGLACLWIVTLVLGKLLPVLKTAWTNASIVKLMLFGATVATIGNCLSAFAMKHTDTGIAATLIGLQPIMVMFIITAVDKKLPSLRAVVGTLIAFSGAVMIFLR